MPWMSSPPGIINIKSAIPTRCPPSSVRIPPIVRIRTKITPSIVVPGVRIIRIVIPVIKIRV